MLPNGNTAQQTQQAQHQSSGQWPTASVSPADSAVGTGFGLPIAAEGVQQQQPSSEQQQAQLLQQQQQQQEEERRR